MLAAPQVGERPAAAPPAALHGHEALHGVGRGLRVRVAAGHLAEAAVAVLPAAQVGHRAARHAPRARPVTASAWRVAPVMSVSLCVERATPKPPSAFCEPASQAIVPEPALSPADLQREDPEGGVAHIARDRAVGAAARADLATRSRPPKRRGESPAARSTITVRSTSPMSRSERPARAT